MKAAEQPTRTAASAASAVVTAILAPSSDANEGLPIPRSGRKNSERSIDDESFGDAMSPAAGHELAASASNEGPQQPKRPPAKDHAPIMLKELTPLAAMPPPSESVTRSTLAKHVYSRIGRNLLFEARPSVVHFGGYLLGKPHSQRVRVVNISRTSQRLHILGPATDCFKMRCNKKGLVAPGSSEDIVVDFHPREHRYHYDCLRLHTDSENLLVPIHAYPVMNDVVFPERVDFGVHAMGETAHRTIKMVCKVPIQFEFEIEVTKSHPHFKVDPLRGMIPANGAAEVHIEHTPLNACSAEMTLLVAVSQFNFTPIVCTVTGAGRPGVVREVSIDATASKLGDDNTLRDSLGQTATSHDLAQVRKLRGQNSRDRHRQQERQRRRQRQRDQRHGKQGLSFITAPNVTVGGRGVDEDELNVSLIADEGKGTVDGEWNRATPTWAEEKCSRIGREAELGSNDGYDRAGHMNDGMQSWAEEIVDTAEEKGADLLDTWAARPPEAEKHPYRTGKGSGAAFDAGGEWLAKEKRDGSRRPNEQWVPPTEGVAFGTLLGGPTKTTVVEGLVIPDKLDTVQATNFVLTQQPGKMKPKDLKEAIRRTRADRQRQLQEREALRSLAATASAIENDSDSQGDNGDGMAVLEDPNNLKKRQDDDLSESVYRETRKQVQQQQPAQLNGRAICAYEATISGDVSGGGGGAGATRQLKEMAFLQDLADTEMEERDRSFKASIEHVGEPLLTQREITRVLEERRKSQSRFKRRLREAERGLLETCYKGPGEVGPRCAKASLLLTGDGRQGVGFRHEPDWDVYKNDDWGRRRDVLRRLVNAVGTWIVRRRADRRLAAIKARLDGFKDRGGVAAMVERDNLEAKLSAGPLGGTSQDSWKSSSALPSGSVAEVDSSDSGWEFPELLATSEALAAKMLSDAMAMEANRSDFIGRDESGGEEAAEGHSQRPTLLPTPPPPEFRLSTGDVDQHRFPIYDEGAALSRREEVVDASGPPSDFVDIDLLPLREPEEERSMGYVNVLPPGLGTYPSIETSRPLRWSAFEECGVRQPRDSEEEPKKVSGSGVPPPTGWRKAISSTERRPSKATLGRRRSSVGLRTLPATEENLEEAWLPAAEAELTALAAEAERVDRMPATLLLRPPPLGGVDLITPDPRYKAFLSEIPSDEASPEWCLRPQEIPREVPITKGLLLGYSAGTTTLRAYAGAPRLSDHWRPKRERRSSGLACMRGQASRGVWQPMRAPVGPPAQLEGKASLVGGRGDARRRKGEKFELVADNVASADAAGDGLSESESEDEEDNTPMPTPADARTVFDDTNVPRNTDSETRGTAAESRSSEPKQLSIDENDGVVRREVEECSGGDLFARARAMEELERKRRKKRTSDAEKLADRMGAIGAKIRNIRHAFVLQTPFHRIGSTTPEGGIT